MSVVPLPVVSVAMPTGIAAAEKINSSYVSRVLRLTLRQ